MNHLLQKRLLCLLMLVAAQQLHQMELAILALSLWPMK